MTQPERERESERETRRERQNEPVMPCQWFKFPNNEHSYIQLSYVKTTVLARETFNHFTSDPMTVIKRFNYAV